MSTTDGEMAGVFIPLLGHIIKAGELISSPKIKQILGDDAVKQLRHRKCPEEKKIKDILDIIGQRKNTNNWTILIEVLKYGCDFIFVPELLLKQYTSTVETQLRSIVSVIKDEDIDIQPLSLTCKCHGLLTEQDIRDISMECYSRGDKAALIVLIDRVVKPHPQSWFKEFLDCMIRAGMKEITRKIELIIKGAQIKWKDVNIDDHWRKVIMELFHGQIVQNVKPSGLLVNLGPVFSMDEKRSIRSLERRSSPMKAMEKLLNMLDETDCEGKWQIFKQALIDDDYGWVNEFIEGDFVSYDDTHAWENLINLFEKTLSQNIRTQEILPYLRVKGIISVKDSEEVIQMYRNYGESEAVFLLLSNLPKRKPNVWYHEFMNILYENGSEHVVKEIDPEKYEKIQAHRSDRMGIDNTEPDQVNMGYDTKVNYTSAKEQNKKSNDNLSSTQTENRVLQQTLTNVNLDQYDEMTKHYRMGKGKIEESYNRLSETSKTDSSHFELLFDKNVNRDTAMGTRENVINITSSDNDSVGTDDLSSSDSDNEWKEDFILRNDQIELVKAALDSKNCIIVAPNGSGKTYVALKIIQDHFEKTIQRSPKVVFLVEMSAQGKKQADKCKVCLSKYRVKLITEEMHTNTKKPKVLSSWLKRSDILIIPAQLVVNALKNKEIKIEDFTLMFFNECHHTDAIHPYVQIMHYYIDLKLDKGVDRHSLPVVVGLTALVSMERAFSGDIAIKKIQKMMANLDARELCTVNICLPELEILSTRKRTKNYFGEALVLMMENIESYMIGSLYAPFMPNNGSILKGPTEKGSDPYTQWISKLWRETAKLNNSDARRYFTTCRQYLDVYNKVLIIYEDARVEDAMQYLERNLIFIDEGMYLDATVEKMLKIYQKRKLLLAACVGNVHHINPKLEALKEIILKLYTEKPDSRVIVFIKSRESVQAIGNWMKEIDDLRCLDPVIFVGTEASGEKGGMTKNDQDNILQDFKEGKNKLIIATSVAEEGLAIQKCSLVIRYDHRANEIAMAQVRGIIVAPARQKDHFGKTLVKLMESTEKHIFTTPHAKMFDGKDSILKAPTEKGSDAYTQWISRLRRETAQIKMEARRYITTWRSYLNVYNQALIIYEDARVKDATNYLEDKMDYLNEGIIKNEIDDTMKRLYDITKPMFVACIDDKSYENPKLKELKTVIFKMLREKRDSRIIVFIKTRDLADAMVNWMRETDGLDRLKPHKFVGAQAAGAKGGMTKKDQTEILKLFKDGNRQIVCATSVAEEGLDIPTCNLVIRYDHVTNETAMIQSRGRGRAEGCQFIIIASEKRKTAEKEEINEIREEIMKEAIEDIQSDIKDNKEEFVEELKEIQRLAKKKRDKDALSEKRSSDNKELELRCEKCNHYICMSTDIKKIQDAHHAVVNDEIRKNVTVIKCNSKRIDHQISVNAGKVKCINCGSGLGQIIKFSEAQFPVLKIEHFYVTDTTGKNSYYKKWKSVPFKPAALSDNDLESRLQGPQYVNI